MFRHDGFTNENHAIYLRCAATWRDAAMYASRRGPMAVVPQYIAAARNLIEHARSIRERAERGEES